MYAVSNEPSYVEVINQNLERLLVFETVSKSTSTHARTSRKETAMQAKVSTACDFISPKMSLSSVIS